MIEISASDFCDSVRDGTHDSPKPVEGHGRPLVTTKHMKDGRISIEDAYLISEADFEKVNQRSQVHRWDVLISMIGTLGELVLVKDEPTFAIKNIGLFKTKSKYDGLWLYYYLQSPKAKAHMYASAQGSTQQYLSLKTLRAFPLSVPDTESDKRAICEVLKTIDDKIELNQKMNQTLEEIAKAIFKSWFVDFDPVRAKAEGRPTGLPPEISDLFPGELVESEIGEIPKGWVELALNKVFTPRNERAGDREIKEFSSTNDGIQPRDAKYKKNLSSSSSKNKVAYRGDFVFGMSREVLNFGLMSNDVGGFSSAYKIYEVSGGYDFSDFVYRQFLSRPQYYYQAVSASSREGQSISQDKLLNLKILSPTSTVLSTFNLTIAPLSERCELLLEENHLLSELRDTLLPKLISGELRIPDAEKFLEEAGI